MQIRQLCSLGVHLKRILKGLEVSFGKELSKKSLGLLLKNFPEGNFFACVFVIFRKESQALHLWSGLHSSLSGLVHIQNI